MAWVPSWSWDNVGRDQARGRWAVGGKGVRAVHAAHTGTALHTLPVNWRGLATNHSTQATPRIYIDKDGWSPRLSIVPWKTKQNVSRFLDCSPVDSNSKSLISPNSSSLWRIL